MVTKVRLVGALGIALLLVGGTGIVGGSYLVTTEKCVSGTELEIDRLSATETDYAQSERVAFGTLSPVEQRIFLEAYTGQYGFSDTYQSWPPSWFEGVRVVSYRGVDYEIGEVVVDCGVGYGWYAKFGGFASLLLGVGVLVVTGGLWARQRTNR